MLEASKWYEVRYSRLGVARWPVGQRVGTAALAAMTAAGVALAEKTGVRGVAPKRLVP